MAKMAKHFENLSKLAYEWSQPGLNHKIDK
jgi:hypothetical protein